MEQNQQGMQQQQYQGPDRRQSQTQYQGGEERRKPDPLFDEPTLTPANTPGMSTQERKDEQEERIRQQQEKHDDQH